MPRLLDLFRAKRLPVSIYFSFGPDRSGVAIRRIWERPGFLKKMRRTGAPSVYGLRTILSGTLLPAPAIAPVAAPLVRRALDEGHEVGVHAWDHVEWHDRLPRWERERVKRELDFAHGEFAKAAGRPAIAEAAPGWTVSVHSLADHDARNLLYASDGRGGAPGFPKFEGVTHETLQIPSTEPTWDELLGDAATTETVAEHSKRLILERELPVAVHTIHAELEGGPLLPQFAQLLEGLLAAGAQFRTLESLARERLADRAAIPVIPMAMRGIAGRAGAVAVCG